MQRAITNDSVTSTYRRWAPIYDIVFGRLFHQGRRAAISAANRIGGRILDVGVGTGIALPYYDANLRIVGIDLSETMLERARARVARYELTNVEALEVMDAGRLPYRDGEFDAVAAQYVINTVPAPEQVLNELARVLKPGGELVLLNRVGADAGARRRIERIAAPIAARLGWRSEFPWVRMQAWLDTAAQTRGMHLLERRFMPPLGHFALIRIGKTPPGASSLRM